MGGNTKTRDVDADHANTVDLFWQQLQWHTAGGWDTQIDDDNGIVIVWIGFRVDRFTDVFEQLAGHQ